MSFLWFSLVLFPVAPAAAQASGLRLGTPFTDHAVLQAGQPLRVWGSDAPGTEVEVELAGESGSATADGDGRWLVTLPALTDPGPHELLVRGSEEQTLTDVAIGEVWFCSGQSNMEWPLKNSGAGKWVRRVGPHENLRYLVMPFESAETPREAVEAVWRPDAPETRLGVSGVAWLFALRLQKELDRPVGVVVSAWGGSKIQAWVPEATLDASGQRAFVERSFAAAGERHAAAVRSWEEGGRQGRRPNWMGAGPQHTPSRLHHGMVHPLEPLNVAGVLWYQGESDVWAPGPYRDLFRGLVGAWRAGFQRPDLPVLTVQLPNFETNGKWFRFRDIQQALADEIDGVELAVTIDVGDADDIHPRRKGPVAERLAELAMATAYGDAERVARSPRPVFASLDPADPTRVLVDFKHVGEGLEIRDADGPATLAIADAGDRWADATVEVVDADTLAFRAVGISVPDRLTHARTNNPTVTVFNSAGLPLRPFVVRVGAGEDEDEDEEESTPEPS